MESPVKEYLEQITVGTLQSYKNLALFPLLSSHSISLEYYLLDEALKEGVIEVTEVSKGGSVPELTVVNKSPKLILILDGEELVGAKQNRVVNTTILLPALSTTVIPVSCVEQGRWSYRGEKFGSEERIMSANLRAMKAEQVSYSVKERGDFGSNQGEIWNAIEEKATRRGARSLSMAMANIYEKDRPSLEEYIRQFSLQEHQAGAVFLINGEAVGLGTFGKEDTLAKFVKKLVESYVLDAIDWFDAGRMPGGAKPASCNWVMPPNELGNDNWRVESEKASTIRVREFRSPCIGDAAVTQPMEEREDEAPYGKRDQG